MTDDNTDEQGQNDPQAFDADAYNAVLETIRRRLSIIEKSKKELNEHKEMLESMLLNDASYQQEKKAVDEAQKKKKNEKARIMKTPQAQGTASKIKDLQAEIKDNKEVLSHDLMQYYQTAGVTEIEDSDGNVQEFEIIVKLKKKRKT